MLPTFDDRRTIFTQFVISENVNNLPSEIWQSLLA